jgi:16S rRNA (uracil1498-N3)-methyltransferase
MASYFYFAGELRLDEEATLDGEEARHVLQARRTQVGDKLQLQDAAGRRFAVLVTSTSRRAVTVQVTAELSVPPASPLLLTLCQAIPKEKALELILQKTTELGVTQLTLFHGSFSSGKVAEPTPTQRQRWERITLEACKQSGRQFPPEISWFASLEHAWDSCSADALHTWFAPLPLGQRWNLLTTGAPAPPHCLWVGPEGGWHTAELAFAQERGARFYSLGPRILRTETAAISVVTLFQHYLGDLNNSDC